MPTPDARGMTRYRIRAGEAWVWAAAPDGRVLPGRTLEETAAEVLPAAELARMSRLHFARDRRSYAAAHSLLRWLLSACAPDVAPAQWRFTESAHGRPELPGAWRRLRFNLSHSEGLVACVACLDLDCGIDVETARAPQSDAFVRHVLAPAEQRAVLALSGTARARLFLRYWTLKEAYVKARGMGMSIPIEQCEFALTRPPRLISHPPDPHPYPDDWWLFQWAPTGRHVLAVAVRPGEASSPEQGEQLGDGIPVSGGADEAGPLAAELLLKERVGQSGLQNTIRNPDIDLPLGDGELFWQVRLSVNGGEPGRVGFAIGETDQ